MCTTIGFSYKEGCVFGRTLEVGVRLNNRIGYVPPNTAGFIPTLNGAFPSTYATLGTVFYDIASFGDGINEKGLMGSNNLFPKMATFSKQEAPNKLNLTIARAFDYLLTRCATVNEVKQTAETLNIMAKGIDDSDLSNEMHFFFMDETGDKVVLEPENGRLRVYDNPFGVLTNAPEFSWHTTNLKNHLHLQPENIEKRTFNTHTVSKLGEGTGSVGLPGDFTPPSRFVRSAYYVANTPVDLTHEDAVLQAFRILSHADIPTGAVVDSLTGHKDETLYTGIMDTWKKAYYIKQRSNIDLQAFYLDDFNEARDIVFVDLKKDMVL
ncbi:choloylglycine hydrolase [Alkalibacterium subtropicum]|uniref:Choloylglycine hydrolase n=1 Tax=Alkalibacterium subtropicum TaxID=753702 RepID=A0A1I1L215_9LACT|nr:linear amide C-N hydrolase [Alkalibacterium subtropicum]SFC66592.1 choloylglycine hydrolase [Alkalibacterium subtropicum]